MRSTQETLNPGQAYQEVSDELIAANRAIINERSKGSLGFSQAEDVYARKNRALYNALLLRATGEKRIQFILRGDQQEGLHMYSQNMFTLSFGEPSQIPEYTISGLLRPLRESFGNNMIDIIGLPNSYVSESGVEYARRQIQQILEINKLKDRFRAGDTKGIERDETLEVRFAENVLRARKASIENGVIAVTQIKSRGGDRFELIKIEVISREGKINCHILPPRLYTFPNELQQLIDEGGGFDLVEWRTDEESKRREASKGWKKGKRKK